MLSDIIVSQISRIFQLCRHSPQVFYDYILFLLCWLGLEFFHVLYTDQSTSRFVRRHFRSRRFILLLISVTNTDCVYLWFSEITDTWRSIKSLSSYFLQWCSCFVCACSYNGKHRVYLYDPFLPYPSFLLLLPFLTQPTMSWSLRLMGIDSVQETFNGRFARITSISDT